MTTTIDHEEGKAWCTLALEEKLQGEGKLGIEWETTYLLPEILQTDKMHKDARGTTYEEVVDSDQDLDGDVCCPVFSGEHRRARCS